PTHQKARDNLALLYAKQGDRERAFELVKRSVGEAEARRQLAQHFPPAQPTVQPEDTFTASFSPSPALEAAAPTEVKAPAPAPVLAQAPKATGSARIGSSETVALSESAQPAAAPPPPPQTVDAVEPAGQSSLEKQLTSLMEQERLRAIQERSKRES